MIKSTLGVLHNITKNLDNIRKHPKKGRETPTSGHAQNILPVKSLSVTSHPVAMSGMHNGTFCTTTIVRKKTRGGGIRACAEHTSVTSLSVRAASGDVTSFPSLPVMRNGPIPDPPKYGLNRADILLIMIYQPNIKTKLLNIMMYQPNIKTKLLNIM